MFRAAPALLALGAVLAAVLPGARGVPEGLFAEDDQAASIEALALDDECAEGDAEVCAISALQMRGYQVRTARQQAPIPEADAQGAEAASARLNEGIVSGIVHTITDWIFGKPDDGAPVVPVGVTAAQPPYHPPPSNKSDVMVLMKDDVKPPQKATDYNGVAWKEMVFPGTAPMHVFTIADWGSLLGENYGLSKGGHTFAITRPGCSISDMETCFRWHGDLKHCNAACGYTHGVDDRAQVRVADAMRQRAKEHGVQFLLNAGDNFYPLGIETSCGHPMTEITKAAVKQFNEILDWVYWGELTGKPWLSVLGNHDYGARQFNYAWDQQIAYTWASDRWIMPGQYFSQRVSYPDQGFTVDFFMLDSNILDAKPPHIEGANICSEKYNTRANCHRSGGPTSAEHCVRWFRDLWEEQVRWLEQRLAGSTADWQVVLTHFPCGHNREWFKKLHEVYGLDLLVTGHVHEQTVHTLPGGMTCLITGGGGGVTSERNPRDDMTNQYGFFDLTFAKNEIKVELVNYHGNVVSTNTIQPRGHASGAPTAAPWDGSGSGAASCAQYGCGGKYRPELTCQCNSACRFHRNCCSDYQHTCSG